MSCAQVGRDVSGVAKGGVEGYLEEEGSAGAVIVVAFDLNISIKLSVTV